LSETTGLRRTARRTGSASSLDGSGPRGDREGGRPDRRVAEGDRTDRRTAEVVRPRSGPMDEFRERYRRELEAKTGLLDNCGGWRIKGQLPSTSRPGRGAQQFGGAEEMLDSNKRRPATAPRGPSTWKGGSGTRAGGLNSGAYSKSYGTVLSDITAPAGAVLCRVPAEGGFRGPWRRPSPDVAQRLPSGGDRRQPRGRGAPGFPTWKNWSFVPGNSPAR